MAQRKKLWIWKSLIARILSLPILFKLLIPINIRASITLLPSQWKHTAKSMLKCMYVQVWLPFCKRHDLSIIWNIGSLLKYLGISKIHFIGDSCQVKSESNSFRFVDSWSKLWSVKFHNLFFINPWTWGLHYEFSTNVNTLNLFFANLL